MLFQPLFDKLLNPPPSVDHPALEVIALIDEVAAPVYAVSTGSPSSTTVDQDAPSQCKTLKQTQRYPRPLSFPNDVEKDNHDIEVAHMGNDLYFGIPIPEVPSDQSSSSDSIHTIVHPDHQISKHIKTMDYWIIPSKTIICVGLARPVSTRLQLHEQALFCYYDAFLTAVEPKTYKDALTQACWIEAMQEELKEGISDFDESLLGCKIEAYKDFPRVCCSYEHDRLPNGCEDCVSECDEVLKLKNFKKDATLKLFKSTNQERYEHVGPEVTSSQDGKVYKMAKRDYAWLMISRMPPKMTSTSEAPAVTQSAFKKLVADSVFTALEAQAANMANIDNTTRPREAPVARQCSYK
ncbi:hypothetical protein Tco_0886390, partial [Tanacetum coccineum]